MSNYFDYILQKYRSLSISDKEIVLPYIETIELIKYFDKNEISLFAWEGWAVYESNQVGNFSEFQGTVSILRYAEEPWNDYVLRSNSFCKKTIDDSYLDWKLNYIHNPKLYFCLSVQDKEESLGFAIETGGLLIEIERQLIQDLKYYGIENETFFICWENACPEGKVKTLSNGEIHNFSGLSLFNEKYKIEGWIDFIFEEDESLFIIYWDNLDISCNSNLVKIKKEFGIPKHVWENIPNNLKPIYLKDKMKSDVLPLP